MGVLAVIFDLDGVILSTDELHYLAWKRMAEREGIFFDRQINERLRGVSRMASLEIILQRAGRSYSEEARSQLASYKNAHYAASLERLTPADVFPGVMELMTHLRERGVHMAIASSSRNTRAIMDRVGLLPLFRGAICDGTNITHSKPDPEVFLKAAAMVAVEPPRCLVIEDADAGIEGAKRAGMLALGVGSAAGNPLADFAARSIQALMAGRDGEHAALFRLLEPASRL